MRPSLEITKVQGLSTVQDGGRTGWMYQGVPPGGALVPELLARANRAVGNTDDAPAVEIFGALALRVCDGSVRLATEAGDAREGHAGETLELRPSATLRVRYLAARGGFDVTPVLGGRGTLLRAGIGGHEGRALRRGDRLSIAQSEGEGAGELPGLPGLEADIRVILGPDLARFEDVAARVLVTSAYTVTAASDRTGSRLDGPPLARRHRDTGRSAPMVRGAIEVPAAGGPIVLGPDHPTTGGYPVIAVVARVDLGRFFARPLGATVRFRAVTLDEARLLVMG